jgi:hypothetical protein
VQQRETIVVAADADLGQEQEEILQEGGTAPQHMTSMVLESISNVWQSVCHFCYLPKR